VEYLFYWCWNKDYQLSASKKIAVVSDTCSSSISQNKTKKNAKNVHLKNNKFAMECNDGNLKKNYPKSKEKEEYYLQSLFLSFMSSKSCLNSKNIENTKIWFCSFQ
jgi:hypothetical protein